MATNKTDYLKLNDWVGSDPFRREEINANFRALDAKAKEHNDKFAGKADKGDVDALTTSLAQIATKAEWISVKDKAFGAKGDWNGTTGTDDTAAIQAALIYASANYKQVYIPSGSYKITSTLLWDGKCSIFGDGAYSALVATVALDSIIQCTKDNNALTVNKSFRYGIINGIQLAGSKLAQKCLYIVSGKGFRISNFHASEALDTVVQIGHLTDVTTNTWEVFMDTCYLDGGKGTDRANFALFVSSRTTDSSFQNIVAINAKLNICKFQGAALRVRNIHAYAYPKTESCDHLIKIEGTNSLYSQLYADTPNIGGIYVTGTNNTLEQIFVLFNTIDIVYAVEVFGIKISNADNRVRDVIVSFAGFAGSDATSSYCIIIDNTGNNVYSALVSSVSWAGTQPQQILKLTGKQPSRLHYEGLSNGLVQFHNSQYNFLKTQNAGVTATIQCTFNNERQDNLYTVICETDWNTKVWVTNRLTTGFTLNFSDAPSATGTARARIRDDYM